MNDDIYVISLVIFFIISKKFIKFVVQKSLAMYKDLAIRHEKIREKLRNENIEACLISTNVNLLYATGRIYAGYFYLSAEGEPFTFVRRPHGMAGENIHYIRKPEDIINILAEKNLPLPKTLLVEGGEISHAEWLRYEKSFNPATLIDGTTLLRRVRSVKTDYEVAQIAESCRKHSEDYAHFPSLYRAGMTDHEITVEMERLLRLSGNLGVFRIFGSSMEAFFGSVLAGDNAGAPSPYDFALGGAGLHPSLPLGHNGTLLAKGMSIMVDFAGNYNGYLSDLSRTFSVGKLTGEAYRAHQTAIDIIHALMKMGKPGARAEDLYLKSLEMTEKAGLADCFMGKEQQAKFVGHGVGLVINELPVLCMKSKDILQENMVIAIEPKFIIDGVGAVGLEDTFVVRKEGLERLTTAEEKIIMMN